MSNRRNLRKDPRDFTGGGIFGLPGTHGTTGDKAIDARIQDLVDDWACDSSNALVQELIVTALKMGRDCPPEGDLKLYNRALKEMRKSSRVFGPYVEERKLSIFGSARTKPEEPEFQAAISLARKMREAGFMSITGAGPGIMEAAQEGSGRNGSFGLNIKLPFEQGANPHIDGDKKLINFNYFFTRKLAFVKESDAIAALPGGFGTMDELFEVLTLIQTGKAQVVPIVLVDAEGGTYWKTWMQFVKDHLLRLGLISEEDFYLFKVTTDVDEAVSEITKFYSNFHSYRYVKQKLVMRLQKPISPEMLVQLNSEFIDLLEEGGFEACKAQPEEADEPHLADLPRLICVKKRGLAGRFRQMIDFINGFEA
ncbi:MAG: TIGR00730 family Rossman fold protein [Verrucomicrobiales bacterium]|nr:TIGR00730 family Rossman fold protein [Verrucomicrobiales bacterium]